MRNRKTFFGENQVGKLICCFGENLPNNTERPLALAMGMKGDHMFAS